MTRPELPWPVGRIRLALMFGVVGLLGCAAIGLKRPQVIWQAYLVGYLAWWLVTVGAIGLFALGHLTGGAWMRAIRPALLAAVATTPLVALLFLPIAARLSVIFPWADPSNSVRAEFGHAKAVYLSPQFFLYRSAGYILTWCVIAWVLSWRPFRRPVPGDSPGVRRTAAISLATLLLSVTFAAFDWGMSLEPTWYSSIYGALLAAEGVLAAHAIALLGFSAMARRPTTAATQLLSSAYDNDNHSHPGAAMSHEPLAEVTHDLGKLLLAFLIMAAYLAFSQLLIIWAGDQPTEISWYMRRSTTAWLAIGITAYAVHIAVPFVALLSRNLKRSPRSLARVAAVVLAGFFGVTYWVIAPAFPWDCWLAVGSAASIIAIGGIWSAVFMWQHNSYLRLLASREVNQ